MEKKKKYDFCNISSSDHEYLRKQFEEHEEVQLSSEVVKYNEKNKWQKRFFVITNKRVFNLKKSLIGWMKISRQTPISSIQSIVVSKVTDEFTLVVPDEYDYRYSSGIFSTRII